MMFRRMASLASPLAFLMIAGLSPARAQDAAKAQPRAAAPKTDARAEDRAAIRAHMASFVKAFEAHDAKALASHWTEEGEYESDEGVTVRGRAALEKAFAPVLASHKSTKVTTKPGELRFISRDSAVGDGTVSIVRAPGEAASQAHFTGIFAREDGKWKIAQLNEESIEEPADLHDELGWLVGDWKSKAQDTEITTTYAWENENKKFLRVKFTIKEKDGKTLSGSQFLGVDPVSGEIRTWSFESEGGIGEGVWVRDGDHWVVEMVGALADGRVMTATNVLRKVSEDLFTWQSVNRRLDDEEIADLPPVKVSRVKADKH